MQSDPVQFRSNVNKIYAFDLELQIGCISSFLSTDVVPVAAGNSQGAIVG